MVIGFIGSGSMAAAIARGWAGEGQKMLFSDGGSGRAATLAAELGGETATNAEIAARADFAVLAVKPRLLDAVAPELEGAKAVVSVLGGVSLERLRTAIPAPTRVLRLMPNLGVEVRSGVLCVAGESTPELRAQLELLGTVFEIPDDQFDAATAVMSCSPAWLALVVGALADAGPGAGLDPDLAYEFAVLSAAGTAELLRIHTPDGLRRAVVSPGGPTEAGLESLERDGVGEEVAAAVAAAVERLRG